MRLQQGNKAPFSGYLFSEKYGKAIADGWSKAEKEAEAYKASYEALKQDCEDSLEEMKALIETERIAYKKREAFQKKKRFWNSLSWLAIGLGAGAVAEHNR